MNSGIQAPRTGFRQPTFLIFCCVISISVPLMALAANGPGFPVAPPGAPFPQGPNFAPQVPRAPVVVPGPQQPAAAGPNDAKPTGLGAIEGAIAGGIGGALLGLVLWAMRKSANVPIKIDPATGGVIAEYAPGLRYMMYGFSAFTPSVLLLVLLFKPPENEQGWVIVGIVILLFAALGGAVSLGLGKARAVATDRGITSTSGFRRRRSMLWTEVAEVSYLKSDAGLLFKSSIGKQQPIKVGLLMAGLKPFTERMRKHLPPERYAKAEEALARIDQLQGGNALPFGGLGAKPASKAKAAARGA